MHQSPFITLSEAAQLLPNPPSTATMYRWSTHGIKGLRLRTYKAGRQRVTTARDMIQFITDQTEDDMDRSEDDRLNESIEDDDETEIDHEDESDEFQPQKVIRSTTPDGRVVEDLYWGWDEKENDEVYIRAIH